MMTAEIINAVSTLRGAAAIDASYALAANPPQDLLAAYRNFAEASSRHGGDGTLAGQAAIDECRVAFHRAVEDALRAAGERAHEGDGQH